MADGLKVKIGADVSQGVAGINQFNRAISQVRPNANSAGLAMVNLGRVVQDAPFGFIGIQNNLNPLLESFQRLKAETGSTSGALKQLAGSLLGPAGIGFALSAASTLLLLFGGRLFGATKTADTLEDKIKKLTNTQKNFADVLSDSADNAGEELSRLTILNRVATDTAASMEVRVKSVQALKREFPDYLKALTDEAILNGEAATAIDKTTQAIIAKARAEAASKKVAEISGKLLEIEIAIEKAKGSQTNAQKAYQDQLKKTQGQEAQGMAAVNTQTVFYKTQLDKTSKSVGELTGQQSKLTEELNKFVDFAKTNAEGSLSDFFKVPKSKDEKSALDKEIESLQKQIHALEELKKVAGLLRTEEGTLANLKVKLAIDKNLKTGDLSPLQLQREVDAILRTVDIHAKVPLEIVAPKKEKISVDIAAPGASSLSKTIDEAGELAKKQGEINKNFLDMQKLAGDTAEFLNTQLGGAFTNFFDDLLSGGRNALADFGKMLGAIIRKLIAAAITAAIFAAIIGAVTGGGNFGQATGQSNSFANGFKNIFSGLGGFSFARGGGVTNGPSLAMIGDNPSGREAVIPFERLGQFANMVGGGNGYIAETTIRGQDLVVLLKKANNNASRLF